MCRHDYLLAEIEQMQMVLNRMQGELDARKLDLWQIRQMVSGPPDALDVKVICEKCGASIPNDGACWYCENQPSGVIYHEPPDAPTTLDWSEVYEDDDEEEEE